MKKWFYYFRDNENRPRVTVCILKKKYKIARGISICSLVDNFSKKDLEDENGEIIQGGRSRAYDRAYTAITKGIDSEPILRVEGHQVLDICGFDLETNYKSEFMPVLSDFEKTLVLKKDRFAKDMAKLNKLVNKNKDFKFDREHCGKNGLTYSIFGNRDEENLIMSISYCQAL